MGEQKLVDAGALAAAFRAAAKGAVHRYDSFNTETGGSYQVPWKQDEENRDRTLARILNSIASVYEEAPPHA